MINTEQRRKFAVFTKDYMTYFQSLVVKKENTNLGSLNDYGGKTIGVVEGYATAEPLQKYYPKIKLKSFKDTKSLIDGVMNNEIDGAISTHQVVQYDILSRFISDIVSIPMLENQHMPIVHEAFGVKKEWPLLASSIQKAIDSLELEKTRLKIKWFGSNETINSNNIQLSQKEQQYIKSKKELTVCVQPNWLPYEGIQNGKFIGISADYLKIISNKLNIPLKIISSKSNLEVIELLRKSTCDIKPIARKGKGKLPYKSTTPYIFDYIALVTKIDQPFIKDLKDYMDKTFVIVKGRTRFVKKVKKLYPHIKIVEADTINDAFKLIFEGKVFGMVGKSLHLVQHIYKYYPTRLKVINEFSTLNTGIGVNGNDPVLYSIIQKTLNSIDEKDKIKIRNTWTITTVENEPDYTFIWYILGSFIIILSGLGYRQYILKKANLELKKQKENFEVFFEQSPDGISILQNHKFVYTNQKVVDILQYGSKEDILHKHPSEFSPKYQPDGQKSFEKSEEMMRLAVQNNGEQFEWLHTRSTGEKFWAEITLTPMVFDEKDVIHVIWRDISDKKDNERLLYEQSKLASMGEMIGNISHQWRQPLSVISTGATGLKLQKEYNTLTDEYFIEACDAINDNAQYLSKTIDDFKNFIKGDREKVKYTLEETIKSFLHLLEGTIKSNQILIKQDIQKDIVINGYPNELVQCFINIFNNSKDVLKDIKDEKLFFISAHIKDEKIIITFKDNAGGIPASILPRIFEPYFTTKHQSQGTGLGLHMTYNLIVEGMNGSIIADNTTYRYEDKEYIGAKFIITLPLF
jgi:PAS domain S-box-containing protein